MTEEWWERYGLLLGIIFTVMVWVGLAGLLYLAFFR